MRSLPCRLALGSLLLMACSAPAQTLLWASTNVSSPVLSPTPAALQPVPAQPCARPAEFLDIDEYEGPLHNLVASFSRKLESKTVSTSHPHRRMPPCALSVREKFNLSVSNSFEPVNFVSAAWDAAWAQRDRDDPAFGEGLSGYGLRYAADVADTVQGEFFNTFLYPAVFHQDPRFYRQGQGAVQQRLVHALRHVFIAHADSGHLMFNYSEWLGTVSSKAVSNLYHPGNERGFAAMAQRTGFSIGGDMGFDVLREFWPEIAHKFHLPFRTQLVASSR